MTHDNAEFIGKSVKDIYGSYMGKIAGTTTDIDGSIQSMGVDCGSTGLLMIPYEQLVMQGEVVIFIPKWRLDSQMLIREKKLTLRRLRAMIEIVAGNDEMKVDAEVIQGRYHAKLDSLQTLASELSEALERRLAELREQSRSAKMLFFDAKIQYKSNEISENAFESVRLSTGDLIEHATHEITEIDNIKERLRGLETEVQEVNDLIGSPVAEDVMASTAATAKEIESAPLAQAAMQDALPEVPLQDTAVAMANGMVTATAPVAQQAMGSSGADAPRQEAGQQAVCEHPAESQPVAAVQNPMAPDADTGKTDVADAAATAADTLAMGVAPATAAPGASEPEIAGKGGDTVMADAAAAMAGAESGAHVAQQQPQPPQVQCDENSKGVARAMDDAGAGGSNNDCSTSGLNCYSMPSSDSEVIFPEPPKNPAQSAAPPKNDDDWLSRMESQ